MKKAMKKKVVEEKMRLEKVEDRFENYEEFEKRVGILDEDQLVAIGWTDVDNGNRIGVSRLEELKSFVTKLNSGAIQFIKNDGVVKKYHIATDLDAGELEQVYMDEHGIDGDDEDRRVVADNIVNYPAYVNRMDYYLCDGDDNADLFLEFVEEV